mmetsp:Transcript_45639/g.84661  ORF Transcript_45639/g.84661 Transcript_45639/m.84661 type:complete len:213 (+) Transcript_45639:300-938(+)
MRTPPSSNDSGQSETGTTYALSSSRRDDLSIWLIPRSFPLPLGLDGSSTSFASRSSTFSSAASNQLSTSEPSPPTFVRSNRLTSLGTSKVFSACSGSARSAGRSTKYPSTISDTYSSRSDTAVLPNPPSSLHTTSRMAVATGPRSSFSKRPAIVPATPPLILMWLMLIVGEHLSTLDPLGGCFRKSCDVNPIVVAAALSSDRNSSVPLSLQP